VQRYLDLFGELIAVRALPKPTIPTATARK
jgi:hypothetical protein